jgi:hypothetical protein
MVRRSALWLAALLTFATPLAWAQGQGQGQADEAQEGKGEAKPETKKAAPAKAPPTAAPVDLAKLRAEYDRLRDELYRARARAQLVEEGVWSARLGAVVRWKGAPDFILRRAEVRLDGDSIWDSGEKPLVDELIKVSDRPIKPGTHSITLRLEVRPGKRAKAEDAEMGYSSEHTFVIKVPDNKQTTVELTADDDGDLPEYEPEVELEIASEKLETGK